MLTKALKGLKITDADQGRVQAVFATFNVKDHDDDVTLPGAFIEGPIRVSAYNHASWGAALPVGKGAVANTDEGGVADMQFFMNTAQGRDTFEVVKQMGELQEWSYGYDVLESSEGQLDGETVNFLKQVQVYEASPVLLGAGINTRTLAAKGRGPACTECGKSTTPLFDGGGHLKAAICECGHIDRKQLDSDLENELSDAGTERFGNDSTYVWLYDHDVDENYAVFTLCPQDMSKDTQFVRVNFNRNDDGSVTLMPDQEDVEPQTTFVPAKTAPAKPPAAPEPDAKQTPEPSVKQAIPAHSTKTSDDAWDGATEVRKLDTPITGDTAKGMYAWFDEHASDKDDDGWPDAKSAYKFPHHFGVDGPASTKACSAVIAALNGGRGGAKIPDSDRKGVYNHAAKHLRDAGVDTDDIPELKEHPVGELKLADHLAVVGLEVDDAVTRVADVVALRSEMGKSLGERTRESAEQLAARLEAHAKTLREVVTSAATNQPADPSAALAIETQTTEAEANARLRLVQ